MGKRSSFERVAKDYYPTIDDRAVLALLPHIKRIKTYVEPCCGELHLVKMLNRLAPDLKCLEFSDINDGHDALEIDKKYLMGADAIITNPVWSRPLLHQMIMHFKDLAPTYLLFDADWMHTKQALPYLKFCTDIISVGRLIWIEGTTMTGKDNCCFYRFDKDVSDVIKFHPKQLVKNNPDKVSELNITL